MLSIFSDLLLTRKTEKSVNFSMLQIFWMIELTRISILPNCQVPISFFVYNFEFCYQSLCLGKKTLI
jgi:hypothetical protein